MSVEQILAPTETPASAVNFAELLDPITRREFCKRTALVMGMPRSADLVNQLFLGEILKRLDKSKSINFTINLPERTTFTPEEVFPVVRKGIRDKLGYDLVEKLAKKYVKEANQPPEKLMIALLAPFVRYIKDKGPSFNLSGFTLWEGEPPSVEIEIPIEILGQKPELTPEEQRIVTSYISTTLKQNHSNPYNQSERPKDYASFEDGLNQVSSAVSRAVIKPKELTPAELNYLKNLLPRDEALIQIGGLKALGYKSDDIELLELVDTNILARLLNEVANDFPLVLTRDTNFLNRLSYEKFVSLLYSGLLTPETVQLMFNARKDQSFDARLFLMASETYDKQKLILGLDNASLANMSQHIFFPQLEDKPDALSTTIKNIDKPLTILWTNLLLDIGILNAEKLTDILTLVEKRPATVFGVSSRHVFQELRNRASSSTGQAKKDLFALIRKLEELAWKRFIDADANENSAYGQKTTYQTYFAIWSAFFTSRGSLTNYQTEEPKPDLAKLYATDHNKLGRSLNELPVELLFRQLQHVDGFKAVVFIASLFNEPKSDIVYPNFFRGLINYLENLPQWTDASARARILSSLYDTVPVAAGMLLTKGLSVKSLTESMAFLKADELRKTIWTALMYHCIDSQRPFGVVTFADYQREIMTRILKESLDPSKSSQILQALFKINDTELQSMASDIIGREKTFEDFSKFFTRKFWPRFTTGRLTYSQPPFEMKELKFEGADWFFGRTKERMEFNRVLSWERFLKDFQLEIQQISVRAEENDFQCQVSITRRDGKAISEADRGTFRNSFDDLISFITGGAIFGKGLIENVDGRYKEVFDKIKLGQRVEVFIPKSLMLNPALLDNIDAYAVAILAQALHHTDGLVYLQPGSELALYDFDQITNHFTYRTSAKHTVGLGPLDIDLKLPHGGDQKGYHLHNLGGKWVLSVTDPDGSGTVRYAYAEDVYRSSKIIEQLFRTDKETIVAISIPVLIEEIKLGVGRTVLGKVLEMLLHY